MSDHGYEPEMKPDTVAGLLGILLGIFAVLNIVLIASTGSSWP